MHYIRLLRPPKVVRQAGLQVELVFTITTDLGDSFLYPDSPVDLQITAHIYESTEPKALKLTKKGQVMWKTGMRVAKPKIALPRPLHAALASAARIEICISTNREVSADGASGILLNPEKVKGRGQIMPVWAPLSTANDTVDVSTRRIILDDQSTRNYTVEMEEEIGESIARHIWDAGVLAMCSVTGAYLYPELECSQHKLPQTVKGLLCSRKSLNVLELGCGVGILGIGLATIFPELCKAGLDECTILMTDLDEAQERARSNMLRTPSSSSEDRSLSLLYEDLDWEDGRRGQFGAEASSRSWDLIIISDCTYNVDMLPALVETLGALHDSSASKRETGAHGTRVFLATKPRHTSERAFFDLMERERWIVQESQILPLCVLGSDDECVEMYLFDRQ